MDYSALKQRIIEDCGYPTYDQYLNCVKNKGIIKLTDGLSLVAEDYTDQIVVCDSDTGEVIIEYTLSEDNTAEQIYHDIIDSLIVSDGVL